MKLTAQLLQDISNSQNKTANATVDSGSSVALFEVSLFLKVYLGKRVRQYAIGKIIKKESQNIPNERNKITKSNKCPNELIFA